jgi:hypothetical protein
LPIDCRAHAVEAINIHWALNSDSKSRSKSDDESRKEIETILGQRKNNWIRRPDDSDRRWGASSDEAWKTYLAIAAESTKP